MGEQWIAEKYRTMHDENDGIVSSCGVVSKDGVSICRAPRYVKKEEWDSYCMVIATAPELLEALENILDNCHLSLNGDAERAKMNGHDINVNSFRAKAKAAISKARGTHA